MTDLYEKTTGNILIRVEPSYLSDQSAPEESRYIWAYRILIKNKGQDAVQLHSRYWRITDANGHTQEIQGEGVVGQQPVLQPGETYEYTSGAPLPTPSGFMTGTYTMKKIDGPDFTVDIPAFSLDSPYYPRILN